MEAARPKQQRTLANVCLMCLTLTDKAVLMQHHHTCGKPECEETILEIINFELDWTGISFMEKLSKNFNGRPT